MINFTSEVVFWAELFKAGLREPRVSAKFEFRFESLKSISVLIFFLSTSWWLEALNITEKTILENAFEHKVKKPRLSANQPSNNWVLEVKI